MNEVNDTRDTSGGPSAATDGSELKALAMMLEWGTSLHKRLSDMDLKEAKIALDWFSNYGERVIEVEGVLRACRDIPKAVEIAKRAETTTQNTQALPEGGANQP